MKRLAEGLQPYTRATRADHGGGRYLYTRISIVRMNEEWRKQCDRHRVRRSHRRRDVRIGSVQPGRTPACYRRGGPPSCSYEFKNTALDQVWVPRINGPQAADATAITGHVNRLTYSVVGLTDTTTSLAEVEICKAVGITPAGSYILQTKDEYRSTKPTDFLILCSRSA